MGKPSSKLRKNENDNDVSLYQIYSSKLHENILKAMAQGLKKRLSFWVPWTFYLYEKISNASRGTFRADFKSEVISNVSVRIISEKGR